MAEQRHIIKTQIIELQLNSRKDALALQNEVSRIYHHRVIPLLENLCNELSDEDTIVRIDSLEIDLGELNLNNLEEGIAAKVEEYIEHSLEDLEEIDSSNAFQLEQHQLTRNSRYHQDIDNDSSRLAQQEDSDRIHSTNLNKSSQESVELELLSYFLQTGMLPWWAKPLSKQELIDCCDRLITTSPGQVKPVLQKTLQDKKQLKRLIYHFPDITLQRIVRLLAPSQAAFMAHYNSDLVEIFGQIEALRDNSENILRFERWQGLLTSLFFESSINPEKARVIKTTLLSISTNLGIYYPDLIAQILESVEHLGEEDRILTPELLVTLTQIASPLKGEIYEERYLPTLSEKLFESQPSIETFSDTDEIYIQNSGLVLLWPFLAKFLTNLGLVEQRAFISKSSAERAVLLLQYLVDGLSTQTEHSLPLNKLLCGIELLDPVDINWIITEYEQAESEKLLCAVIQNWSILGKTSIAGLRKAFLQRKGLLKINDGSLQLHVERESYDVLIDRIPWNIDIVKLPWTNEILYVDWS